MTSPSAGMSPGARYCPEAEPSRTDAERVGADLEDEAPELEALPDESVHGYGTVPPADPRTTDGNRT